MRRSALERKYYKYGSDNNKKAYRKQKHFCSKLYKKERKKYYSNLDIKTITDNKKFWQTVMPFFTDKGPKNQNITLVENNCIISNDQEVSESLNKFFTSAVNSLNISENKYLLTDTRELIDPVEIAFKKIESHPSVFNIKDNIKASHFSFSEIVLSDIENELKKFEVR